MPRPLSSTRNPLSPRGARRFSPDRSSRATAESEKYDRAAIRWHVRFVEETKNVDIRESQAVLVLLAAIPANRLAAVTLADLLSRRRSCERIAEALVRWSREA